MGHGFELEDFICREKKLTEANELPRSYHKCLLGRFCIYLHNLCCFPLSCLIHISLKEKPLMHTSNDKEANVIAPMWFVYRWLKVILLKLENVRWCFVNSIPILISATNTIKVLRRSTLKKHQLAFKDNVKNLLPIATWDRKLSSTDAAILRSTWKQGRTRKTIMHSSSTSALVSAKI